MASENQKPMPGPWIVIGDAEFPSDSDVAFQISHQNADGTMNYIVPSISREKGLEYRAILLTATREMLEALEFVLKNDSLGVVSAGVVRMAIAKARGAK